MTPLLALGLLLLIAVLAGLVQDRMVYGNWYWQKKS